MSYRIDFFSVFIFLGIAQALFLSLFYFSKENRKIPANFYQGWLLLAIAAVIIEIFLMYSGYIQHVLHLVDFSESIALAIGPLFYFMVKSHIEGNKPKGTILHLLPFILFSFYLLFFLIQPVEEKYNSWIHAYHPDMEKLAVQRFVSPDPIGLRSYISLITISHVALYGILCAYETFKVFKMKKQSFFNPKHPVLKSLKNGVLMLVSVSCILFIVKLLNKNDTGDHWIGAYAALTIYLMSFSVIKNSVVFKTSGLDQQDKYRSSSLSDEVKEQLEKEIHLLMSKEQVFLQEDCSLSQLAKQLKTSHHVVSQVINESLGKNFYELMAEFRIAHAQKLLKNPKNSYLKIEEIAAQSGYNSKSSFNTAFKKITGLTPSQFRNQYV